MPQDTTEALELAVCAQLIEDRINAADLPPPDLGEGEIAAFSNGVFLVDGADVVLVERSSTSPTGWARTKIAVPRPQTATETQIFKLRAFEVSGQGGNGAAATVLNLICQFRAPGNCVAVSWLRRVGSQQGDIRVTGAWENALVDARALSLLSQATQVEATECGVDRGMAVYGITDAIFGEPDNATAFIISPETYLDLVNQPWIVTRTMPRTSLPSGAGKAAIALLATPSSEGGQQPADVALLCHYDATLWWAALPVDMTFPTDASSYRSATLPAPVVAQWVGLPLDAWSSVPAAGHHAWQAFQVDGGGGLWRLDIDDSSLQSHSLLQVVPGAPAPAKVVHLALATHGGMRSAFAVDGTGALWTVRDVTSSTPTWVNLGSKIKGGKNAKAVACPPATRQDLQVYYATETHHATETDTIELRHASQRRADALWNDQLITVASDPATTPRAALYRKVSTVTMDLSVTLAGAPVPDCSIAVSSDMLVTLIVKGGDAAEQTLWVGDGDVPVFQTDAMGRARVRLWAKSLGFPRLEFTASSATVPRGASAAPNPSEPRVCRGDVVDNYAPPVSSTASRLSGAGDASKADPFSLSPATLMTKQQTGTKKKPHTAQYSLLPAGTKTSDGQHVVDLLHSIGTFMQNKGRSSGPKGAPIAARSWHLNTHGNGIIAVSSEPSPPGGAWDDFTDFVGDAVHYVTHTIDRAADWTVHVADDALHFAVGAYKCAVTTAEEAGALAGCILHSIQKLAADIETFMRDVVAFFELLFAWDDILRTHDVLRHMAKFLLGYAQSQQLTSDVNAQISGVANAINKAIGYAAPTSSATSISRYADQQGNGMANRPSVLSMPIVDGAASKTHLKQHSSRCHYVFGHAKSHATVTPRSTSARYDQSAIDKHWFQQTKKTGVPGSSSPSQTKAQALTQSLVGRATGKNPDGPKLEPQALMSSTPDPALTKLFAALVAAAADGIEDVVDAILGMAEESAGAIDSALTDSPDIPVISWLWENVLSDDPLTLLDVFCLILAVPGTILCKLVTEDVAPFDGGARFDEGDVELIRTLFVIPSATGGRYKIDTSILASPPPGATPGDDTMPAHRRYAMILSILSAVLGLFSMGIATTLDYYACDAAAATDDTAPSPADIVVLGYVSTILSALATLCAVPIDTFVENDSGQIAATTLYWASQFLPILSDLAALRFEKQITEMVGEGAGAIAEGLFGVLIAALGLVYDFEGGASHWDIAGMATNCFPRPWRLLIAGINPETIEDWPILMPFIMITDAVGLVGGTATTIGSAIVDNR